MSRDVQIVNELSKLRKQLYDQAVAKEEKRTHSQLLNVLSWIDPDDQAHEDDFQRLAKLCHPGSSDWFKTHSTITSWIGPGQKSSKVWVQGKPGCGMYVYNDIAMAADTRREKRTQRPADCPSSTRISISCRFPPMQLQVP